MDSKFGWNPKIGDRVEGVTGNGGTGHFGTIVGKRRDGFVVEWDVRENSFGVTFKDSKLGGNRSVHQSYGFRKVEESR